MAELTASGLEVRTQAEILAAMEADQRVEISTGLDQSTSSPLGQLSRLISRAIAVGDEALAALYMAIDPDSNSGDGQTRIAALTGTIREPASASRVTAVCDLDAGSYPAGTLLAAPAGRPTDIFASAEAVTSVGGATSVIFVASDTGPLVVAANTLEIAGPVAGWNAITSHPDATPGRAVETDEALRIRRNAEVESPGSSSASGIVADLTRTIPEIVSAYVVENPTENTVDSIPPFSFEAIVFGPASPVAADDDAVAAQILASKAAGPGTYGTTTRTVLDSEGQPHAISFTRPAEVPLTVALTLQTRASLYAGDAAVQAAITARALSELEPGLDVSGSMVAAWAYTVAGVLRVTSVSIDGGAAWGTRAISSRQIATISSVDITVTSAGATP